MNKIKYQALKAELDKMTEKQLRERARSLMRTANRRIQTYRDYGKEGLKNLSLEAIKDNLKSAKMYNESTGKITMKGLDVRGLKTLITYQEELKEVETVNKYKKEVLKSYETNNEYVPADVLESIGKTEVDEVTGKEVDITDYNYLYRAGKAFMKQYGSNYKDWIEAEVLNGNIESRGDENDNLADFFKLYLKEYNGKEFTAAETKRMSNYEWKQFNKYSRKLL